MGPHPAEPRVGKVGMIKTSNSGRSRTQPTSANSTRTFEHTASASSTWSARLRTPAPPNAVAGATTASTSSAHSAFEALGCSRVVIRVGALHQYTKRTKRTPGEPGGGDALLTSPSHVSNRCHKSIITPRNMGYPAPANHALPITTRAEWQQAASQASLLPASKGTD